MKDNRYLITLVHGTWANNADWTLKGSTFRRAIADGIKKRTNAEVAFTTFLWSGKNTHKARRRASDYLDLHVKNAHTQYPVARHFVVAHSHGGNVALRMLRTSSFAQSSVEGLVCLATPFLEFEQANPSMALVLSIMSEMREVMLGFLKSLFEAYKLGTYLLFLLAPIYVSIYYIVLIEGFGMYWPFDQWAEKSCTTLLLNVMCTQYSKWLWSISAGIMVPVYLYTLFSFYRFFVHDVFRKQKHRLERARDLMIRQYGYFQPIFKMSVRLCIYSSSIDEALGVLSGSWWMHYTGSLFICLYNFALIGVAVLTSASLLAALYFMALYYDLSITLGGLLFERLGPPLLVLLLILLSLLITFSIFLSCKLANKFGPGLTFENPEEGLLCKVRARRKLPYPSYEQRIPAWDLLWSSPMALFHSRIYSSIPVVDSIAKWMCCRQKNT